MLRINYETAFGKITSKILSNQAIDTNGFSKGINNTTSINYFYAFIALDIIDSLQSSDTDTQSMNSNLDFLQTQWIP